MHMMCSKCHKRVAVVFVSRIENGETVNDSRIITSVSKVLDCAEDYEEYMALGKEETLVRIKNAIVKLEQAQ